MRLKSDLPSDDPFARLTVAAVALELGIPDLRLDSTQRGSWDIVFARQVAMYLLNCSFGLTNTRIGKLFGRDRSTVSHACRVVEDSRDDPVFNAQINRLEDFLRGAPFASPARRAVAA